MTSGPVHEPSSAASRKNVKLSNRERKAEATQAPINPSMPPLLGKAIYFGPFLVTHQVFHLTPFSFALVNLKPLLPGHVLVSPLRPVPRLRDLTGAEVADLFQTVQQVSRMLERVFHASAFNVAVQDGADAGQSVSHVHAHVIPRRHRDLDAAGGNDAIYGMLEGEEGDVGRHLREWEQEEKGARAKAEDRARFPAVDADEARKPRSAEEMRKEAEWLAGEMEKDKLEGLN